MSTRFSLRAAGLICALLFIAGAASAQNATDETLAFQQRVDEAARVMDNSPRLRDLSHERRRGIVQFVAGNMLFTLLHEMGHALRCRLCKPLAENGPAAPGPGPPICLFYG